MSGQQCTYLDATNVCGEAFAGFPVLTANYATVSDFNKHISTNIANGTNVGSIFKSLYGCKPEGMKSLRYQVSWYCANIVQDAISKGCSTNGLTNGPVLCASECSVAKKSLTDLFGNKDVCDGTQEFTTVRNSLVSGFSAGCDTFARVDRNAAKCLRGMSIEGQFCGGFLFDYLVELIPSQVSSLKPMPRLDARMLRMNAANSSPNRPISVSLSVSRSL